MASTVTTSRRRAVVDGQIVRLPRRIAGGGAEPASSVIEAALAPRVDRGEVELAVRAAHQALRSELAAVQAYSGGLPLEIKSAAERKLSAVKEARKRARQAVLSRRGRRIDLPALLQQRRADGSPVWCVRDPMSTCSTEGTLDTDGTIKIAGHWRRFWTMDNKYRPRTGYKPVGGIPPLPPEARRHALDKHVRKHAAWVALLYQPAEWREVNPDPAIVVEWKDRPGEYYALCVWGDDRAAIMEFVD